MEITQEKLLQAADILQIDKETIPDTEEVFYIVGASKMEGYIASIKVAKTERDTYKAKCDVFANASAAINKHIDFEKSPLKSAINLQKIVSNPEKYPELGPFLDMFRKNETPKTS